MGEYEKNIKIRISLSKWYEQNKRSLPWRDTHDPYIIWISEVILQQTRVNQGYDYFQRFIKTFPDVKSLAEADEQEVLKLWQGLGYYSRARNLHNAAKEIMSRFNGQFPVKYEDVLSLKGIGEYTAAAIVSFSYNQPYAVVDGNVYRVLSRLYAIEDPIDSGSGKKIFTSFAQELLDKKNPGNHNQAIMELGSLQCIPVNPDCSKCPVNDYCLAYMERRVAAFPVKKGKTQVKNRYFNYLDIRYQSYSFLNKRTENDIWKNLYELPLIETDSDVDFEALRNTEKFISLFKNAGSITINSAPVTLKHILSHRIIYAKFYRITITNDSDIRDKYTRISSDKLSEYPISRLAEKYFEKQNGQ